MDFGLFTTWNAVYVGDKVPWDPEYRGGKLLVTDRIESLRRFRDDVREVQTNYECGIGLASFHDIEEGDVIECYSTQIVSRAAVTA